MAFSKNGKSKQSIIKYIGFIILCPVYHVCVWPIALSLWCIAQIVGTIRFFFYFAGPIVLSMCNCIMIFILKKVL